MKQEIENKEPVSVSVEEAAKRYYPKMIDRMIFKDGANWQKYQYENKIALGLEDSLTKYIKEKHTQEECIGFSDGFKKAKEQDKALLDEYKRDAKTWESIAEVRMQGIKSLEKRRDTQQEIISELLEALKDAYSDEKTISPEKLATTITKAEQYLNK